MSWGKKSYTLSHPLAYAQLYSQQTHPALHSFVKIKETLTSFDRFDNLVKPWWNPPDWLFGPVWTVLYVMIAASAFTVYRKIGFSQV
jgi:tryptophan-rich sensory protein